MEEKKLIDTQDTILGKKVRDIATGVIGVATAHTIYLGASSRVAIEYLLKGTMQIEWIDEGRLEVIE